MKSIFTAIAILASLIYQSQAQVLATKKPPVQSSAELQVQMDAVVDQVSSLRKEIRQTPDFQSLQIEVKATAKAYEDAVSSDPEISDVDKKLADLRSQTRDLMMQRLAKEKKLAATTLSDKKSAMDDAQQGLQNALNTDEVIQAKQQMTTLTVQIQQTQQVEQAQNSQAISRK